MTHPVLPIAVVVGLITAGGVLAAAWLTNRASDRAARLSAEEMKRQSLLSARLKIAEFRQSWINSLREAMAHFMALGKDPTHTTIREIFEAGMMIELLMNRGDARYPALSKCMSDFSDNLESKDGKYEMNEFVTLCQDILKTEWEVLKKELRSVNLNP